MDENKIIAARLAELRTFSDYSAEDISRMLDISTEDYLSYESGETPVPINFIYRFAAALGTEPAYITTGVMPTKVSATVVYGGNGVRIERYAGYSYTALAPEFKGKTMNPMLVEIDESDKPELVRHGGQELNYVLEGNLRVIVGEKEYYLHEGDSIFFDPSELHAQLAMGGKAKFLTVING